MAYKKYIMDKYLLSTETIKIPVSILVPINNTHTNTSLQNHTQLEEEYEELLREHQTLQIHMSLYLSKQKMCNIEIKKLKEEITKLKAEKLYEEKLMNNINNIYDNLDCEISELSELSYLSYLSDMSSRKKQQTVKIQSTQIQPYAHKKLLLKPISKQTPQQKADKQERMKIAREAKILIKKKNLIHLETIRAKKAICDSEKQDNKRKQVEDQELTISKINKKVKINKIPNTPIIVDSNSKPIIINLSDDEEDTIRINLSEITNNDDKITLDKPTYKDYDSELTETDDELTIIKPTERQKQQVLNLSSSPFPIEYTYVSDILFSSSNMYF